MSFTSPQNNHSIKGQISFDYFTFTRENKGNIVTAMNESTYMDKTEVFILDNNATEKLIIKKS